MGGGGGGGGISLGELAELQAKAREALKEAAEPARRNVFISFATEDIEMVRLLRGQVKNELSELNFNDYSLREPFDSENAEYIRNGIRERIKQSSVTVVFVSESTPQSRWVDWEIRESLRLGKGVVAMHQGSVAPSVLPTAVVEHRIEVVQWNHSKLAAAIEAAGKSR